MESAPRSPASGPPGRIVPLLVSVPVTLMVPAPAITPPDALVKDVVPRVAPANTVMVPVLENTLGLTVSV